MKKVIILLLVFGTMPDLAAQKQNKLDTLIIDQLNVYKDEAVKLRNTGIIVAFTGVVIIAAGWNTYVHSGMEGWGVIVEEGSYFISTYVGIPTAIVGIILCLNGSIKKSLAEIAIQKFNIVPENSMALGLGLTIKF